MMTIDESKLKHWIENFYGYGSWEARFWFVSHEEGGGDLPEDVADRINYFYRVHPPATRDTLCDIRELYRNVVMRWEGPKANLFANRHEYRFDENAVQNTIWKNLTSFLFGYKDLEIPDPLEYQKQNFVSPADRHEALIPLYPLPSPHNHAWYYSWLDLPGLDFIRNRTKYQEQLYAPRMDRILSNIRTHKPEMVLMYGMENINALKKSVQQFFPGVSFKMNKATKLKIPQHHRATLDGTILLITTQIPALRHNRIETGFDWEEFGKRVKSEASTT